MRPRFSSANKSATNVGRNRDERRFADSHQGMANQQFSVVVRDRSQKCESTPKERTERDDHFARIAVRQWTHEWSRDHVEHEKRAGQVAELRFGETKFRLY